MEPWGDVEGLAYARCAQSGSLFLAEMPEPEAWYRLLEDVHRYRHSPEAFHSSLSQSRTDNVYMPRLEWMEDALQLQGMQRPVVLEAAVAPSEFSQLLYESGSFSEVLTVREAELTLARGGEAPIAQAAVLLESLDRAYDPEALLSGVSRRLSEGGLLFVTALVSSGFDLAVLGLRNLYLYPPDRANCFSLQGLSTFLQRSGFGLLEVSTPGVLDVEIVQAHLQHDPSIQLSVFERQIVEVPAEAQEAFQAFLQQYGLSSFARIVAKKSSR